MPRDAKRERERVERCIRQYVEPVYADPSKDDRPLSAARVAAILKISRMTLRKYDQLSVLRAADSYRAEHRTQGGISRKVSEKERLRSRIAEVSAAAEQWKQRYSQIHEMYLRLEFYLRQHRNVDFDALVARAVPKANRKRPGSGTRRRRLYG